MKVLFSLVFLAALSRGATVPVTAGRVVHGNTLPATCTIGMIFHKDNASAGSNIYTCTSTNTWTAQAGGGGGGSGNPAGYTTVTFSATPTFTAASNTASSFKITLTGNVTSSTLAGAATGQVLTFSVCQDGTGSRTFVPPTNVLGLASISATASTCSQQTFVYDGTNAQPLGVILVTGGSGNNVILPGSSSGSTTLQSSAAASGTLTLPARTGTISTIIATGTSALGTSAISSAACASVVTTTATGTATTDAIIASFNGDPTGVTGYVPLTTGMLAIIAYPSANNVNFKVCNNTGSSITPGAITLNWTVVR